MINLFVFYFYIITYVFDGILRYYLQNLGIAEIIYIRDVLLLFAILKSILFGNNIHRKIIIKIISMLSIWIFIGLFNLGILQVLFGIKILLPFFFGIVLYQEIINPKNNRLNKNLFFFLLIFVYLGILIDFNGLSFWKGYDYEIGQFTLEANRKWGMFGIDRISGFARVSFDAAIQIVFLTTGLIVYNKESKIKTFILFIVSLLFIALTTTKGALLALFLLGLLLIIFNFKSNYKIISLIVFFSLISPAILFLSKPFIELIVDFSYESMFFFSSLYARIDYTWVEPFKLLDNNFLSLMIGRGIGGIGISQKYFEPLLYNPGDNILVYLTIQYGIIFSVTIIFYTIFLIKDMSKLTNLFPYYLLIIIIFYGIISNVVENPLLAISIGLIISSSKLKSHSLDNVDGKYG